MTDAQKLDAAMVLIAEVKASLTPPAIPAPPVRQVDAGMDLVAVLEDCVPGETVRLANDFVHAGELVIDKAVRLEGGTLIGPTICTGAGVTFDGVTLRGLHRDHTILTTGDDCQVLSCTVVGSASGQHRGICVNSKNVTIRQTAVTNIWSDIDTQAIGGWDGTKNLLVEDCILEASGENIMFGGADPSSEANIPQDITIRRCAFSKPLSWRDKAGCVSKNLFELKNAKRVLVEDCTMEYSWVQGQTGFGILLTVRNQDGNAPYSTIEDVTFRRVTVKHCASGISLLGTDDNYPSQPMKRVLFEDVTFEDIDPVAWGNGMGGRQIQLSGQAQGVVFRGVAMWGPNNNAALMFSDGSQYTGLEFHDCDVEEGEYGIYSPEGLGLVGLLAHAPGYVWNNVAVHQGPSGRTITYPAGTTLV